MNTETAVVVSLVLAVLVVVTLYSTGSSLVDMGEGTLMDHEDNISNPEDDEKYWLEDDEEETSLNPEFKNNNEAVKV